MPYNINVKINVICEKFKNAADFCLVCKINPALHLNNQQTYQCLTMLKQW